MLQKKHLLNEFSYLNGMELELDEYLFPSDAGHIPWVLLHPQELPEDSQVRWPPPLVR